MTVEAAICGLNTCMKTIRRLNVYDDPPESINQFPSAITYIGYGETQDGANGGFSLHTLIAEIYIAGQLLPQAVDEAKKWPDLVRTALKYGDDPTWGGTISHVVWPMRYKSGAMRYIGNAGGEKLHYGIQFTIPVKINEV